MRDEAIYATHPNVVAINAGADAYDADGNSVAIDEVLVSQKLTSMNDEINRTKYKKLRELEYPAIGDQLDALFHAGVFPAEMAAKIQAVKEKYPK